METVYLYIDRIFTFAEWAWGFGGWWAVGGAVSLFVFIGLGIQRSPY